MSRPPSAEGALSEVYRSPADMLAKLEREYRRFCESSTLPDLMDHVTNFSVTGWHLVEWVWVAIRDKPAVRIRASQMAGGPARPIELEDLQRFLLRDDKALQMCFTFGTQAKHVKSPVTELAPVMFATGSVSVEGTQRPVAPGAGEYYVVGDVFRPVGRASPHPPIATLKLLVNGERHAAAGIMEQALERWRQLFAALGLDIGEASG
ncbi:MAG: hypothetical protein LCH56_03390 [Proteobacteria bacterium]|nr:hypothetical protein [Pseudomonadota bacterium]